MLLALHRQATRSHRPSMAMPLAAAPYRASGLVLWHFSDMSGLAGEVRFYLRTPGAKVLPKALWTVGARGKGAAGPVFRHVGTASVEPTEGHTYDPTEGATTDPYPAVPAWASAAVPERANAVASTNVLRFMAVSFLAVCR